MIKSVYNTDQDILKAINQLYLHSKGFDLDPTYSKGRFYKNFPEPKIKGDIKPLFDDVFKMDITDFADIDGFEKRKIKRVIFDPPFLFRTGSSQNKSHICKEYGVFDSLDALLQMYENALINIRYFIKPKGILVFKCQDTSNGGENHFIHNDVLRLAEENGFKAIDLFIKVNEKVLSRVFSKQGMARKTHCYWWVFRKR